MTSQFAMTFVINLLLNGVMSQLWNVFNTLQIIMALPLLNVLMPSNVLLVQDVLLKIVNFEFIDKEAVYEEVVEPILADDEESEQTNNKNYLGSSSLLKAILLYVLIFIIVSLLITILVVCKICLLPKCCACF